MKFKGFKIGDKVYLVNDAEIDKHGSLESAAKLAKAAREKFIELEKPKKPKAEKVVETPIESEPTEQIVE